MGGKAHGGRRVSWQDGHDLGVRLLDEMEQFNCLQGGSVCGSIRRMKPEVGDVDLVVLPSDVERMNEWLAQRFGMLKSKKPKPSRGGLVDGVQVDILVTTPEGFGAAVMHFTGSQKTNVVQRARALRKGLMLNERGLWDRRTGEWIAGRTEEEVYAALGLEFVEPASR
jgi:DNA polymerase (family 10)